MGQEKELRPYREPPCDSISPQVTHIIIKLGFEKEQIEEAVISKMYNTEMAAYLILSHSTPKRKSGTSTVRPFPAVESFLSSFAPFLIHSIQPSGQKDKEPASPPASLESRTVTCAPRPEPSTATPPAGPESRTAIPSLVPRPGPWGTPSTHKPSSNSSRGAPGGTNEENPLRAGQPNGEISTSFSGHIPGCQEMVRRLWNFLL